MTLRIHSIYANGRVTKIEGRLSGRHNIKVVRQRRSKYSNTLLLNRHVWHTVFIFIIDVDELCSIFWFALLSPLKCLSMTTGCIQTRSPWSCHIYWNASYSLYIGNRTTIHKAAKTFVDWLMISVGRPALIQLIKQATIAGEDHLSRSIFNDNNRQALRFTEIPDEIFKRGILFFPRTYEYKEKWTQIKSCI